MGDGSDEGWLQPATKALHFRDCEFEGSCHVLARHIAGSEDKFADGVFFEGTLFEEVITDAVVRSEQDSAVFAYHGQPRFIQCSLREMGEVPLKAYAVLG